MKYVSKCPICGENIVEKEVREVLSGGNNTAFIKIKVGVCLHCGERLYTPEIIKRIEEIETKLSQQETSDGCLEIDNNWIENLIRPVVLGRKNYLFAGPHDGARRAAMIYSFVATARQNNIEPFAYLKDVIARIADHPYNKLELLLPHQWKPLAE